MLHLHVQSATNDSESLPPFTVAIPPEIFYRIYHFLTDDLATLSACTRVSKQWHGVARQCLFSTIVVRGQPQYSEFCDLVVRHPDIGTCIGELEFHPAPTSSSSPGGSSETLNLALLSTIVPKLTSLRRLTFWSTPAFVWEALLAEFEVGPPVTSRPVSFEKLHFGYTDRDVARSLPSLFRLLSRFGCVDTVVFEALNPFAGHTLMNTSVLAKSVRIRRVIFEGCAAQAVHVDYFHRIVVPGALQSVTLSIPHYSALDAVTRMHAFFKESAMNVVDLEILWLREIPIWPAERTQPEEREYSSSSRHDRTLTHDDIVDLYNTWKLLSETIRCCNKLQRLRLRAPGTQTLTGGTNGFLATFETFETLFTPAPSTVRDVTVRLGTNLTRTGGPTKSPASNSGTCVRSIRSSRELESILTCVP
ncbi:hypothetical protein GSI_07099 [Ganoderma sinense ZZ0214-1]|uniref:Uncharacterized protein n=1 Tax=Ganoderma sinense ZZ0214-1 TaxID=1077348 RepID=A0A2G8SAZ5_9APHY|nr:hypothetical protein GSI_07099 [Ganoderma sinense ZZ0214-1]